MQMNASYTSFLFEKKKTSVDSIREKSLFYNKKQSMFISVMEWQTIMQTRIFNASDAGKLVVHTLLEEWITPLRRLMRKQVPR